MFDHWLRSLKDRWFAPLAQRLGPRVTPNLLTLLALSAGIACAIALANGMNRAALALWIGNRLLDGLDGTQARVHGLSSAFGGYLDIILDFVIYAAVPLAMIVAGHDRALDLAGATLLASFFVNAASWMYLSAVLEQRAAGARSTGELTTVTMPPGIIAGAETVVLYASFIIWPSWRVAGFLVMAGLVGVNVIQRLVWAWRRLDHNGPTPPG